MKRPEIFIPIKLEEGAKLPEYAHGLEDSASDLFTLDMVEVNPYQTKIIKTGVSVELPVGYEFQVRPRSGIAAKGLECKEVVEVPHFDFDITLTRFREARVPVNIHFGTIDAGYRGDIGIILTNLSDSKIRIEKHTKIAQMVLMEVPYAKFIISESLDESSRGEGGFGSTGVKENSNEGR